MAEKDQDKLRNQIRRYRNLHALNHDPDARRVLEELIKEAQAKLNDQAKLDGQAKLDSQRQASD